MPFRGWLVSGLEEEVELHSFAGRSGKRCLLASMFGKIALKHAATQLPTLLRCCCIALPAGLPERLADAERACVDMLQKLHSHTDYAALLPFAFTGLPERLAHVERASDRAEAGRSPDVCCAAAFCICRPA